MLRSSTYQVLAVMDGNDCPVMRFLTTGEAKQRAYRAKLLVLIERVATDGLQNMPSELVHLVDRERGIYEFVAGRLRLFFFKGAGNQIAICTSGLMKKTQRVDGRSVVAAARCKAEYEMHRAKNQLEVVR